MNLKNKIAVVTGASDGLGKEVAFQLAKEKAQVVLLARNKERLQEVEKQCLKLGSPKVKSYICDISDKEQLVNVSDNIISDFKQVDALLNIAGIWQRVAQLEEASVDDIENVISTNLTGLVILTKLLLPVLRKSKEAAIINVSSHSGIEAKNGQTVYCASKWGVTGFTETLRVDLKETNIRVAGLYQGGTQTGLFEKANDPKDRNVFKRFMKPKDLASVILFMLSQPPQIWLHDVRVEY